MGRPSRSSPSTREACTPRAPGPAGRGSARATTPPAGGRSRSGRTRHGSVALRTALTEAAHAAARTKNTYLAAHHAHIRGRRGLPKAIGATRHDLLIAYWHVVHDQVDYADLGPDWAQRRRSTEHRTRRLVHQLEQLGHTVTLEPAVINGPSARASPWWSPDSHLSLCQQVPVTVLSARPAGACRPAPRMDRRDDMPTMTYPTTASEQTYIEVTGGVDTHKDTHTAAALDASGQAGCWST